MGEFDLFFTICQVVVRGICRSSWTNFVRHVINWIDSLPPYSGLPNEFIVKNRAEKPELFYSDLTHFNMGLYT